MPVVNSKSIPKYAITTGMNFGVKLLLFAYVKCLHIQGINVTFGTMLVLVRLVLYKLAATVAQGLVFWAQYYSSVAYCGHYVGESGFCKEEFVEQALHLRKERMNAKSRGDYEDIK